MADILHLVDKPEGWTSHDAVARLRTVLGEHRVGHAGTLDPFASGLLLVGEGRATGVLGCLGLLPKRYLARARFGVATDTQDRTGATTRESADLPTAAQVDAALERFRGAIRQRPPLYSAVKVGGTRLYKAARKGLDVEREERTVHVYALTRVDDGARDDAGSGATLAEVTLDVTVSRGTYVRTIAHDLGEVLGCGAHLSELRRVASGPYRVEDALSCDRSLGHDAEALRGRALSLDEALSFLPRVALSTEEASRLRHGQSPSLEQDRVQPNDGAWPLPPGECGWPLALAEPGGGILALARPWEAQAAGDPALLQRVLVGA
ncbi:MAG: tRNA pseudouridine(55) synthase TruB [Candidatus Eiseniibacteriota bacterium]